MRIKTFGAKRIQDQLPRIEVGFQALGHHIIENDETPDLLYANDPGGFDAAIQWRGLHSNLDFPIIIFNIQDLPKHLFPNYNLERLKFQLNHAHHVTSISQTTQKDIKHFLGIDSTIIYQPVQPTYPIPDSEKKHHQHYDFKYLIVGRNSDPNKRNALALKYLQAHDSTAQIASIGSEPAYLDRFESWFGVVAPEVLNDFYNSVDFIFSLTKYGGIELSQIEAVLAGKFPIVCNDSDTAMEFNPEFACDPTPEGISQKVLEIQANPLKYKEVLERKQSCFRKRFDKIEVAKRILCLID